MSITRPLENLEETIPEKETKQRTEFVSGGVRFRVSKAEEIWYQSRGYQVYLAMLFPEHHDGGNERDVESFRLEQGEIVSAVMPNTSIATVCGGRREFFKDGSQVLDIGSGSGKALKEMNELYGSRGVKVIGIDEIYAKEMPSGLTPDIAVSGDWQHMPFEDNTFDRLLSCESNLRHLDGKVQAKDNSSLTDMLAAALGTFGKEDIPSVLEATRVAKEGAIWRATQASELNKNEFFLKTMTENGWEVFFYGRTMIARLTHKSSRKGK